MYRITSNGPSGMNRTLTSYPDVALEHARAAEAEGRTDIWIADDEGNLFSPEDFAAQVSSDS